MTNYNFNKLLDSKSFELLGKDILEIRENLNFEVFSEGTDQGIDIRYENKDKLIIGQVKRYKEFSSLYNDLKNNEFKKVKKLNPDRYIIVTSVALSPSRKAKIKELFSEYIKSSSDIIGEAELNTYLGNEKYKSVEEAYPQLWINSSNVLKNIIRKEVHSDIHNYTVITFDEIKKSTITYIKNDCFEECFRNLEKRKCLLICGEAGIGKTTLAYNLIAKFLTKHKGTEFVSIRDINDFYKAYDESKEQLFLFDDFFGIKFSPDQKSTDLKSVIEIISKKNNKYLVLTAREYVLRKGYLEYPELESFFDKYKLKLNVEDLSDLFKARILFRNLENSDLEYSAIYQLANSYRLIIKNSNYSPRVINEYINYLNDIEEEIDNYTDDIIKFLNKPHELWKEIFSKQSEGAQLLAFLILLFNNPVKLDDIKELFYKCLDDNYRINARKKDFSNYVSQLENTIITTYTDEYSNDNIYFRFKNSSMELYVHSRFYEVIDEYGEYIVKSTKCLNNLTRLANYNNSMSYEYDIDYNIIEEKFNINEKLQNKIIDKIINEFDKLYYIDEEEIPEAYTENRSQIPQLMEIMNLYNRIKKKKLKSFIYKKTEEIMRDFYENPIFNYTDSLLLFYMIEDNIDLDIGNKFNIESILETYLKNVRFSRQLIFWKRSERKFPDEHKKFLRNKSIEDFIIRLTLDDAEYFLDELFFTDNKEKVYAMVDELTEMTIPELFESFKIKYKKWYVQEIYDLTNLKLFNAKKELLNELEAYREIEENDDDNEDDYYVKRRMSHEEEIKTIKNEKKELLNNYYERFLEDKEIEEYLNNNLENESLIKEIIDLYNNSNDYCIIPLLYNYKRLEFLKLYLDFRNKLDENIKEFFSGVSTYLKSKFDYINDNTINAIKKMAYDTLKDGKIFIYESQILKHINIEELEELKNSKIIYNKGKRYYFITEKIHIIWGIYGSFDINKSLMDIFESIELTDNFKFYNYFDDICWIYSEIDENKFHNEFLLPVLKKIIKNIKSDDMLCIVNKFIKFFGFSYGFNIEKDESGEKYVEIDSSTINGGIETITLDYLGFDPYNLIYNNKSDKEMVEIFEKYFPNNEDTYEIDLSKDCEKLQDFIVKQGIYDYICEFYNLICKKINEIEKI